MTLFGHTRSTVRPNYAVLTPQGMVAAPHPDWPMATCTVAISPALGARFSMLLVQPDPTYRYRLHSTADELLIYVRSGGITIFWDDCSRTLAAGGVAYIPPSRRAELEADRSSATDLLVFQRLYVPSLSLPTPQLMAFDSTRIPAQPFMGDDAAMLQLLLPDLPDFDLAVNIFTFQPGATLPIVETHVMEHGLLMLQGQGIYRLGDDWHPVQAGDMIWMAPFCPQWFVATGKQPASYIYYKDVHRGWRHP
jgi:(S)-ureidoglycine aminohydrolase